ncbi:glutaredoxin family protein [Microbacterium esteraromaticum]|uniref:glutaredoxin family protein n=1 Tax=Microbacterium esteraromaticum TaxID=57043 RepID=UPI001A8CB62E|nr:glutaredoxin family protein [Microbacterium esteraromaticum]MBN8424415.1 glutaredoxin family protein [Microbacterium esteraromaticum]
MRTVTVYSTGPSCQRCRLTCQRLDALGIRYHLVDVHEERNAALRAFLFDELGYREAPIVQVGTDRWSGFRPDLIDALVKGPGVG